uniref:hypothetical protein n=1 Tax=uncultured Tenacibaculum sp. TaxID=174713 RepID=UPI0026105381|nr:hypothetical protein [uncultured Tenacibaculum sp.]
MSNKLFQDLKNTKKYAIWIDGKAVDNNVLNNYKNTDFYNYSGSFVHKNARSKRFPQEHQYQLNTKEYIQKIKEQLPPPPPPAKNKKEEVSNIPSPPPPMSAKELVFKYPNAIYYIDNKEVTHIEAVKFTKKEKDFSIQTQETNSKKIIKFYSKKVNKNTSTINTSDIKHYLDGKLISKEKLDKIAPKNIKKVEV